VQVDRHLARTKRMRRILPAAGSAALIALTVVACTGEEAEAPRTATVSRGTVAMGVSATGSLSAISQQNVGFPNGGQLTQVFVKVGDHVEAGQVVATVDDFAWRQTLAEQRGQLQSQQASLDRLVNSPVVEGAKDSLSQAKDILDATRKQAKAVLDANETAIDNAERQHDVAKKAKEQAEDKLAADKKACRGGSSNDDDDDDDDSDSTPTTSPSFSDIAERAASSFGCSAVASDEMAVTQAEQQVVSAKSALDNAVQKRDVDKANGDLQIENAEQAVVNAQNNADSASSDRPFNIEQQKGVVATAQAAVARAQRDVDNATLKAPVAGTVSAINGVVGEYLAPSSGTSALAPGSGAAIPGTEGQQAAAAGAAALANPTRPGGTQFLMLDNIDAFQVVVPFNEADVASILPGQKVNVAVDALPDLTLTGTVLSVAPTGTSVSGVISYYVTIVIDGKDPRLKDGQTARATVVTQEVNDVLTVPSNAVRQENGRSIVTVVEPNGNESTVSFEPGTVGPERTQVISGLREGQQVVLPVGR
jgi:HlyD family secretion protein